MKQDLVEGAVRLPGLNLYEQVRLVDCLSLSPLACVLHGELQQM